MKKANTKDRVCAGVDIGKSDLFYGLPSGAKPSRSANTIEGRQRLIAYLEHNSVQRVGMEASGGYEIEVAEDLRAAGFEVVVFQPKQVKAYATFKLERAKSDPIDAVLIAQCTAACDTLRDDPDPRLIPFAEHLTMIEQIEEDIARAKVRRERYRDPRPEQMVDDEIKRKTTERRNEIKLLLEALRAGEDLARKLELLMSIQGVGERTALALVVRMPELGKVSREEVASLLGVAPFVHESGRYKGQRRTGAGRARARTSLFAAAQAAARRWNPALVALYNRLIKAGKPHNVAIIACVRKMIIYANTVIEQNRPWEIRASKKSPS